MCSLVVLLLRQAVWAGEDVKPSVEIVTPQSVKSQVTPRAQDVNTGNSAPSTANPSDSMDYWENDDFVPFEGPFKDIGDFDWNLSKVIYFINLCFY